MSNDELEFLRRVRDGLHPGLADRKNDRIRQKLRRAGYAEVAMNPRRWVITEKGKAALDAQHH